jgi:hypothetical protein
MSRKLSFIIVIAVVLFYSIKIQSAPLLITDNRIENLNGFPTIGRGYSLHSNKLQSICFKTIEKTKPTFDLNYELQEVDDKFFRQISVSDKDRLSKSRLFNFVKKYYKEYEDEGKGSYPLKNLIVRLEVNTYYYALDETQSILSDSVEKLLEREQYVSFFNSCGQYYVRAVGSFSTYLALIQYRMSGDPERDKEFNNMLEKGLFKFSGHDKMEMKKIEEIADVRDLRVFIEGTGLTKKGGEIVNLIPLDINQFRKTVQDAVKLMQEPNSGIISSMEVVPWVENPNFIASLQKERKIKTAQGEVVEKSPKMQFIRQQRLIANSGVITEINNISNMQIEKYNIATMCLKGLFSDYVDEEGRDLFDNLRGIKKVKKFESLIDIIGIERKIRKYDMDKTMFYNLADENNPRLYLSLRDFIRYFAQNDPIDIFVKNGEYLYGPGWPIEGGGGALDCIKTLLDKGLDNVDYREIKVCRNALEKSSKSEYNFVNQYCLPKPAKLVFRDEIEKKVEKKIKKSRRKKAEEKPPVKEKPKSLEELKSGKESKEKSKPEDLKDIKDKEKTDLRKNDKLKEDKNSKDKPKTLDELTK